MLPTDPFSLDALDNVEGNATNNKPSNPQQFVQQQLIGQTVRPNASAYPQLTDEHLHPPDENGMRKFTDAGKSYLGGFIPDNTGLISSLASQGNSNPQQAMPGLQPMKAASPQQVGAGLQMGGKLIGSDALEGTGAALSSQGIGGLLGLL